MDIKIKGVIGVVVGDCIMDEFDKIIEFFSLEERERESRVEDVFDQSLEFIEKYKYLINKGSDREKEEMQAKMSQLRERLHIESAKVNKEMGMDESEVKEFTNQSKNFSEDQWAFLQKVKNYVSEKKSGEAKQREMKKEERIKSHKQKKGTKHTNKKKWIRS